MPNADELCSKLLSNYTGARIHKIKPNAHAIILPHYKENGDMYEILLIEENGFFYLSDAASTYKELDRTFEMSEPDVIKNLVKILKKYGCTKQQGTNAFILECSPFDIHVKVSHFVQALSFMLNMKIFYV